MARSESWKSWTAKSSALKRLHCTELTWLASYIGSTRLVVPQDAPGPTRQWGLAVTDPTRPTFLHAWEATPTHGLLIDHRTSLPSLDLPGIQALRTLAARVNLPATQVDQDLALLSDSIRQCSEHFETDVYDPDTCFAADFVNGARSIPTLDTYAWCVGGEDLGRVAESKSFLTFLKALLIAIADSHTPDMTPFQQAVVAVAAGTAAQQHGEVIQQVAGKRHGVTITGESAGPAAVFPLPTWNLGSQ